MVAVALSPEVRPVPVPSVEEHISQLKAAAKNSARSAEAVNGDTTDAQNAQQSAASNGNNAYLPPPEVARQIPCRYYPNCSYAEKCIFLHPQQNQQLSPVEDPSASSGTYLGSPTSNGQQGNVYYDPNVMAQMGQPVYYYPASVNGNGSSSNAQNEYGAMQQLQQAEYIQYSQAAAYAAQQQQQYYGYAAQHMQAYGNAQYPQYAIPYVTQGQQAMYAAYPQAAYAQQQQPTSPINGQSQDSSAIADPAIISQAPRQQSPSAQQSASTTNGVTSPASATAPLAASQEANVAGTTNGHTSPAVHSQVQSPSSNTQPLSPSTAGPQASFANYVPVPMAMPVELQQATYNYASHPEAVRAQAQLEADFAKAAISGQSRASPSSSAYQQLNGASQPSNKNGAASATSPRHERSSSMQMHTFFQTGGESAPEASSADASAYPSALAAAANGNALSASISSRPPNGAYHARAESRSRADGAINGAHVSGHAKRASFGGFGNPRAPGNGARGGPWPRAFDPSRPVGACVFFAKSECRYGDACHNTHLLRDEVPVPGQEGKMTRDAKALRMNIGGPDGNIATHLPFHTKANRFNGEGPRGAFNGPRFPNGFPAQQQQQQQQATTAPEKQRTNVVIKDESDVKEKFEKLISETPRLNGSHAEQRTSPSLNAHPTNPLSPSSGPQNQSIPRQQIQQQITQGTNARPNSISPNGRKANNVALNARQNFGQRIPSGEKDFPALSVPATASAEAASPAPSSTAVQPASTPSQPQQSSAAQPQSAPNAAHSAQQQQAPAQAAAKPAFSWASAAAKAASLPDPPKRAISKPRPAPAAKPAETDAPAAAAAQALTTESTAAPAVTA